MYVCKCVCVCMCMYVCVCRPMYNVCMYTYMYVCMYVCIHRRMRRAGRGGCSPPPQLLGNSVFGQRRSFFYGSSNGGRGGGVFQFSGGRMTSRGQCPRGVLVKSPPSGNPVSAPVICVIFRAINPSPPLTKAFPYAYVCIHTCICMYVGLCMYNVSIVCMYVCMYV